MNFTPQCAKVSIALTAITLLGVGSLFGQDYSAMRPALVGNGPKSLVNLINTKHLMERGVKHGALFFFASVHPNGFPAYSKVWGMTKETEPLRDELRERLIETRFVPAIYNHQPVYAGFYGTLTFSVIDGKPHLRIFANQELPELQKESDFISPQALYIPGHIYDYTKVKEAFGSWWTEDKPGVAEMSLTVDASGNVKDLHVANVTPPQNQQYANAAAETMRQRVFLPAYRNGKPVDSTTHFKYYFVPAFYRLQ
jgi:TonB-like protein